MRAATRGERGETRKEPEKKTGDGLVVGRGQQLKVRAGRGAPRASSASRVWGPRPTGIRTDLSCLSRSSADGRRHKVYTAGREQNTNGSKENKTQSALAEARSHPP